MGTEDMYVLLLALQWALVACADKEISWGLSLYIYTRIIIVHSKP